MATTRKPSRLTRTSKPLDWVCGAPEAGPKLIEWSVGPDDEVRADLFVARQREVGSRGRAREALERGKILLNGETMDGTDAGRRLVRGDRVAYWPDRPGSAHRRSRQVGGARDLLRVAFEDAALLVADKPAGLLVEPLPGEERAEVTLLDLVADHLRFAPGRRPLVVHRIDRDTSGLVLFAKTRRAQEALKSQFERRTPERVYLAIVHGRVEPRTGTWRDLVVWDRTALVQKRAHGREAAAKEAVAEYRVVEQWAAAAHVEVRLTTGKRNQIRYQAGARGWPLVGERIYTFGRTPGPGDIGFARQALHARRLAFRHPETDARLVVEAPVPSDLTRLMADCAASGKPGRRQEGR